MKADELKRLHEAATPVGWIADEGEYEGFVSHDNVATYATLFRPGPNNTLVPADARLIAALRNAAPELIAVLEAVERLGAARAADDYHRAHLAERDIFALADALHRKGEG